MPAEIGQPAPAFELVDQTRSLVSLESLLGKKSLIKFIPFPFTAVCEGEVCEVRDNLASLTDIDTNIVVITCDTVPSNIRWATELDVSFPILSDFWPHGAVAQAYGCFNEAIGVAMRSTYVLDEDGIVRDVVATPVLREARSMAAYHESLASI
jgi:peroxiredoxin